MIIQELKDKGLIHPPHWLPTNCHYLTIMGSVAYGVSSDTSDMDIYGFAVPPKQEVFPHLKGEILGFGNQVKRFEQWSEHHIKNDDALGGKGQEYDFTIFGIVKYFQLCMENNPNALDSLFTPQNCVLHITKAGTHLRESRRLFLHKGCFPRMKGYAYSQLAKVGKVQEHEEVLKIRNFEDGHDLPHDITLEDLHKEMEKRGLSIVNCE